MFELRITVKSIEEAERILACLKHDADPAAVKQVAEQVADAGAGEPEVVTETTDKPKRGRPRREVAPPLNESAAPSGLEESDRADTGSSQQTHTQDAPAVVPLTLDNVKAALMGVQAKYGAADMAKPLAILGQFNAGRISEVKAEDYPAFIEACKAA